MTPKKLPSGSWHTLVYIGKIDGKNKYKSVTAPTKKECMLKAAAVLNKKNKDASDPSVKEMVQKYIDIKEPVLSPSTIREYIRIYKHDFPPLYDFRLSDLNNVSLQSFVSSLNKSPKTIANIYRLLIAAVGMYSDRKYSVTLPRIQEPNRTVATEEQIQLLLNNADYEMQKAILLGACSLRRGEICALKYEDIKDGVIFVHADLVHDKNNGWLYKDHAKTPESTRFVNIPRDIITYLGTGDGYVVNYPNPNALTQSFSHLRDRLGINISLHSLRRFYASICHAIGIPEKYVMKQGGWKSRAVLEKSYQHTLDKQGQEYAQRFENFIKYNINTKQSPPTP